MVIQCRVYQARNGLIYLSRGDGLAYTSLTLQQVSDLRLDLYSLDDFSLKDFKRRIIPRNHFRMRLTWEILKKYDRQQLEASLGALRK